MIHIVMGTKGQFVKMLPVLRELDRRGIPYNFVDAAQHVDITRILTSQFGLKKPDYVLANFDKDVSAVSQIVWWFLVNTVKTIIKKRDIFPQGGCCLVHGDAPPAMLGLVMAKLAGLKVVHVEAGERTHNLLNPFPEEAIRRIVDLFADVLFASSPESHRNLLRENVKGKIYQLGFNTVLDSVRIALESPATTPENPYVLASIHRFETIVSEKRLKFVVDILRQISNKYHVVMPLHESTKKALLRCNLLQDLEQLHNLETLPLQDYFSFINLIKNCVFMVTDGGGPQQETFLLNTPCLLLREASERENPNVCLAGFDAGRVQHFLSNYENYRGHFDLKTENPARMVVDVLEELEGLKQHREGKHQR